MREIFDFKISYPKLERDDILRLRTLYMFYLKLYTCYKWKYKRFKRLKLALNLSSVSLVSVGTIVGSITLNPIILGTISTSGLLIQAYITKSNLNRKVEMCRFAYTSYKKILVQLKSYLDGLPFDENVFLSDAKVIDDIVIDLCPTINGMELKYYKTYNNLETLNIE